MQTYTVDIAGEPVALPIVPINQKLAISLLMVIDMGVKFGERVGKAMADHLRPLNPDIIVGAATLGIPVVIEVSRALGLDQYIIAHKSPKIHLADALVQEVESVTSAGKQRLMLDRRSVRLFMSQQEFGRPYVMPPDVPADRLAAMRAAFEATMTDPEFVAGAEKIQMDISPLTGAELDKLFQDAYASPPEVVARTKALLQRAGAL